MSLKKRIITTFIIICISPLSQCIYGYWQETPHFEKSSAQHHEHNISIDEYQFNLIMELVIKYNPRLAVWSRHRIVDQILKSSREFELDPFLIASVIAAESSFRPSVTSPRGAQGLMQLIPAVQPSLGVRNAYSIEENIHGGCLFLSQLWRRFNDTTLALAAYNAGPTRVARLGRVPRIRETQSYIKKVEKLSRQLSESLINQLPPAFIRISNFSEKIRLENILASIGSFESDNTPSILTALSVNFIIGSLPLTQKERFNALSVPYAFRLTLLPDQVLPQRSQFFVTT